MSILKTEAFVLKSFKYKETSKIVTLFTKDFGKLNAIVKGARNFKSKLCGTLETMNHISAVLYIKDNRELQFLSGAEYKNSYRNILNDFDKLQAAFRIIELINKSVIDNSVNHQIFDLLVNTYSILNHSAKNYFCYVLYFQIEMTNILGISPDFLKISSKKETFFDDNEFYISKSLLISLNLFRNNSLQDIESLEIEKNILEQLIQSYDKYLSSHLHEYKYYNTTKVFAQLNILD